MLPAELKTLFNLPAEVPDPFLSEKLTAAERDLERDTSATAGGIDAGMVPIWNEALGYKAYALAVPFLHLFTLQGASRAERLAAHLDARFMDARENAALVDSLNERYRELVVVIVASVAPDEPETGGVPGIQWVAI